MRCQQDGPGAPCITAEARPQGGRERSSSRSTKPLLYERLAAIERKANGRPLPNLTLDEGVLKIAPIENRPRRKRRNSRRNSMRCCRVRITLDPAVNFARFRQIAGKPGDDHRFRGYAGSPWGRATRAQCALIKATSPGASSTRTSPTATPPSTPSDRRNWQRGAARLGRAAVSQSEVTSVRHHADGDGNSKVVFTLCKLLGFQFAPWIPDLKSRRPYAYLSDISWKGAPSNQARILSTVSR